MLITIIAFIVILGLLVFVHELGHFITAKKLGAGVEEFGFGFPPRMVGAYKQNKKWKLTFRETPKTESTIYSLNWIPLGGFVKITGEDGSQKEDLKSFANKKIWQRGVILSAGVVMNFLLAVVILSAGFMMGMPRALNGDISGANVKNRSLEIVTVAKNSPASEAEIKLGDQLISINGQSLTLSNIEEFLEANNNKELLYTFKRGDSFFEKNISLYISPESGKPGIGVGLIETGVVSYPLHLAVLEGAKEAWYYLKEIVLAFYGLFKKLLTGAGPGVDLSGPVGIAVLTGRAARLGFVYLMQFAAILSINLAVINFLPFPALDGGRLLFLLIEKLRGKPIKQKTENAIHNIGFALLMVLILFVTFKDLTRFGGGLISKFLN